MGALIRRLSVGYLSYHETNKSLLEWIGVVGTIAFPLLYALRYTGKLPPLYDDLPFRLVATVSCLLMALRRWWPAVAQPYYPAFTYATVLYSLAFMLPFTLLQNRVATPSVVNMVVSVVLVVLLTDWRNTIVMLVCGYTAAIGAYWLTAAHPQLPIDFLLWWFPVCAVLVAGGSIGKHVEKRAELERLRRLYAGLAGSVAHEVRNPLLQVQHVLNAIDAALEGARTGQGRALPAEQAVLVRQALEQGRSAVARGLQSISVTLQQLNPSAFEPSKFRTLSAAQCVRKAAAEYAYESDGQRERVVVNVDGDFSFRGEETVFILILFNLLKNALYYLPVRPEARVTIFVDGAMRQIVVHDTGPGIAQDLLPRLFEEFHSAGKAEGTGLGLAFCKRAMQAFGGTIDCRSELDQFTQFTMTFPEIGPAEAAHPPASEVAADGAKLLAGRTMMVVDDQALNRAAARAQLAALGAFVVEAEHGEQALQLLRDGVVPAGILMDVNMPGLDGIQTTQALRTLSGQAGRVPVVAVTGNDSASVRESAMSAGMQAVLAKPVDSGTLASTLGRLIEPGRARTAAPAPAPASPSALLDIPRIDDFRRMGLMEDLLPDSLTGMRRLVQELHDCTAAGNAEGIRSALHTLVGVSGETGARALHHLLRHRYREMLESRPPEGAGWIEEVRSLLASTEEAFLRQYGVAAAVVPMQVQAQSARA